MFLKGFRFAFLAPGFAWIHLVFFVRNQTFQWVTAGASSSFAIAARPNFRGLRTDHGF
jgi:hypothetical protein